MFFSKKGAKVLAIASTFAFVLTGMSVVPGKAQAAADQAPTVKVLGATLRLDDNNGTQSLRFGIQVNNASNAEACGINLGYNGKTITVATDVEDGAATKKNTTLYSKDSDNDTIVYSAVITGIPSDCYENDFSVKGYVKDKIDNINKGESIEVKKSVSKVVDALKKQYPDMGLELDTDTGKLMKKNADGVLAAVEAKDFGKDGNGNADIVPEGAAELDLLNDYVQMAGSTLKPVGNEDGSVKFEDADGFAGVLYKIPYSLKSQEKVHVTVEYECTGCTAEGKKPSKEARAYLNEGNSDNRRSDETLVGSDGYIEGDVMVTEGKTADELLIKADSYNTSFASLTIKKITVAAVEVTAPVEKPVTGFNEDGTMYTLPINKVTVVAANTWEETRVSLTFNEAYNAVTISRPEGSSANYGIRLPEEIYKNNEFCKAIITYRDSTNADNCGYVAKYNTNEMSWAGGEERHSGWNKMQGEGTAEVVPDNCYGGFSGFRIFDGTAGSSITITSVVFVKSEDKPNPDDVNDIIVKMSSDTAHTAAGKPWWYMNPADNEYLEDGSTKAYIGGGRAIAFYFNEDKTPVNLTSYSKVIVTLSTDADAEPIGLAVSNDPNNLAWDGHEIVSNRWEGNPANKDLVLELDVSSKTAKAYGIVIADRWASGANFTIKSIEVKK